MRLILTRGGFLNDILHFIASNINEQQRDDEGGGIENWAPLRKSVRTSPSSVSYFKADFKNQGRIPQKGVSNFELYFNKNNSCTLRVPTPAPPQT